jgi:hypothetical protein
MLGTNQTLAIGLVTIVHQVVITNEYIELMVRNYLINKKLHFQEHCCIIICNL